jgi:iron complex outermembrane receptor protein
MKRLHLPRPLLPAALMIGTLVTPALAQEPEQAQEPRPGPEQEQQSPTPPPDLSELSLEELAALKIDSVYGASMYLQKVTEAPASVTILTAAELQRFGYRTLADALRSVRGFYVTNDRNYSYLGVRGFSRPGDYNARILLLIDGHRLNDNVFGSALLGTEFPLDLELVDRIEIIRGPSSSLYGTSAFFGVINVITRRGDQFKGVELEGGHGTFTARRARGALGWTFGNGVSVVLGGSSYAANGQKRLYFAEFDDPATNHGVAENADRDRADHLFGTVNFRGVTAQGMFGSRTKAVPTASFGTVFNDARSQTVETQGYLALQYKRALAGRWELASRASFNRYLYDGDYVFDHSTDDTPLLVVNKDFARGNWWGTEATLTRKVWQRHTLALGGEFRHNSRQDQYNYDEVTLEQYLDDRRSSTNWALYVQDEVALHRTVRVNVGLRHDYYDTFGGTTNPRIGVIYSPVQATALKLLYGQAFRAPNAYELFWRQTDVAKANPELRPETNQATELVLEQYLGPRMRVTATGFHYTVRDLITQQTDPHDDLLVYNNVDAIAAKGLELELEGKWASGLQGRVGYTYQHSRNEQTGLRLTNSPSHLTQLSLISPLGSPRLFLGVESRQMSARRTISGAEVGAVFLTNLTLFTRELPHGVDLSASLFNAFDTRFADPGSEEHRQDSILQNGRSLRVRVIVRLPRGRN